MSTYSRRQAIGVVVGFAASAAPAKRKIQTCKGTQSWTSTSNETVLAPRPRGTPTGSPDRSGWILSSRLRTRDSGGQVTFEPGARTAWHTHPLGQTLVVTAGLGWVQREGGPIGEIRAGDVVWFPSGLKHWHGASPTTAMTHIAIQEPLDGKNVDWMEKVADDQYRK